MNKYPDYIMENVRQNLGLEKDDTSKDDMIMQLDKEEVFNRYCEWRGLLGGYGYLLWDVVNDIKRTTIRRHI